MRRQDKVDTHEPKDLGVHARKAKQAAAQPAKPMGKAAAANKAARDKD